MNQDDVKNFALAASDIASAMAAVVRAMGMQAENQFRTQIGESISYGDDAFQREADIIEGCAFRLRGGA